jgi:hypothetical protein
MMTCWLCNTPVPEHPAPGYLVIGTLEIARVCQRHAADLDKALRTVGAFKRMARLWVENRARRAESKARAAGG